MCEKKSKARSIRMTETVEKYVMSHPGDGFNQKFENIILHFKEDEPALDKRIKEKKKIANDLQAKIDTSYEALSTFNSVLDDLKRLKNKTDQALKRFSE